MTETVDELLARAGELREAGNAEEALSLLVDVIGRLDGPRGHATSDLAAKALLEKGITLFSLDRVEEAARVYNDILARFGEDEAAPPVRALVAETLMELARVLDRLERHDEEIAVSDDVVARFGGDQSIEMRDRIASALYSKAVTLSDLGQDEEAIVTLDELIARCDAGAAPELRERAADGLSMKAYALYDLGRPEEAIPVYHRLIAEFDEPETANGIAWALLNKGKALVALDRYEDCISAFDTLLARFADEDDSDVREHIAESLSWKAWALVKLGRRDEAFAARAQLITGFRDASELPVSEWVLQALRANAAALDDAGRTAEAVALDDDVLSLFGAAPEPSIRELIVRVLVRKAERLQQLGQPAEACIVFDSAAGVLAELIPELGAEELVSAIEQVTLGLLYKIAVLCSHDRQDEAAAVPSRLAAILAVPVEPVATRDREDNEREPDEAVAALLAHVHGADAWATLAATPANARERAALADRALALYERTASFIVSFEALETPLGQAVMMIRNIADGYAMLSRTWRPADQATLPLPKPEWAAFAANRLGVSGWASDHGHPLDLTDTTDTVEGLIDEQRSKSDGDQRAFAPAFTAATCSFETLAVLTRCEAGREAIHGRGLRAFAAWQIVYARHSAVWAAIRGEAIAPAGVALLLMAEASFVASRAEAASVDATVPDRGLLRDLLTQSGAGELLVELGATLPSWLIDDIE